MSDILRIDEKPPRQEKIFFGESSGVIRVDYVSHEVAKTLKEKSEGHTWFVKEVNYTSDKSRFSKLNDDTKRLFYLNIVYQTLMDSGVSGGLNKTIANSVSSCIFQLLYTRIIGEEHIHAESYSYGLSQVLGYEADEIIDLVYTDEFIKMRMKQEDELFQQNFDNLQNVRFLEDINDGHRMDLLKLIYGIYFLESIKFPFSFLVTFVINNSNEDAIPGFTKTIRLIANDELNVHVPTGVAVLDILEKEEYHGFSHLFKNQTFRAEVQGLFEKIIDQEIEWAHYLLENRKVNGLTVETACYFIKHQAYVRGRALGLNVDKYKQYSKEIDIIKWYNNYKDIDLMNSAVQESSLQSYTKGLKNDLLENIKPNK